MAAVIKWTLDEDDFIRSNFDNYGPVEMSRELEKRFGVYRSRNSVTNHCKILGVSLRNPTRHHYTEEQIQWVRENARGYTKKQLLPLFKKRFGIDISYSSLDHLYCRNDILPENRGLRMIAGERNPFTQRSPIGSEMSSGGKIYVKVADLVTRSGDSQLKDGGNWIEKKRYIYANHFGPIPDGYDIVCLDHNKENFDPDNLYAVSRKVNMIMSANQWWSEDPELTLAAVKWCELYYVVKNTIGE